MNVWQANSLMIGCLWNSIRETARAFRFKAAAVEGGGLKKTS